MKVRWLELSYYKELIAALSGQVFKDTKIRFYIFSEGEEEDFSELKEPGEYYILAGNSGAELVFCLKMSAPESFLHLCYADILLTAPSGFSMIAGAINRGVKITPEGNFLVAPRETSWIRAGKNGELPEGAKECILDLVRQGDQS